MSRYQVKDIVLNITISGPDDKHHVWKAYRQRDVFEKTDDIPDASIERFLSLGSIVEYTEEEALPVPTPQLGTDPQGVVTPAIPPSSENAGVATYADLQKRAKELGVSAAGTASELLVRIQEAESQAAADAVKGS